MLILRSYFFQYPTAGFRIIVESFVWQFNLLQQEACQIIGAIEAGNIISIYTKMDLAQAFLSAADHHFHARFCVQSIVIQRNDKQ